MVTPLQMAARCCLRLLGMVQIFQFVIITIVCSSMPVAATGSRQGDEEPVTADRRDAAAADREWMLEPTVMVAMLVRNKAHTLPYFLYYLQQLDYPKQRIRLW